MSEALNNFQIFPHTELLVIVMIPLTCLLIFFSLYLFILHTMSKTPNFKNKLKIILYFLIKFIGLPFLIFFLIINAIIILFSILLLNKVYYVSPKMVYNFFSKVINSVYLKCKCKKDLDVNVIHVTRKPQVEEIQLPERANKYKEVDDDSKQEERINVNENNKNNIFEQDNIKNMRPQINTIKTVNKSKVIDFLSQALVCDDNSPSYISILNMMKKKAKESFDRTTLSGDGSNVNVNN
jgi:hypothetical protein